MREPSYDTNLDHVVRTAATELRKRLAIYYLEEKHRSELRIGLIPGSYIPRFTLPEHAHAVVTEPETSAMASVLPTAAQLAGNFNFTTSAVPGSAAFNFACIANPALATNPANAAQCYPYVSNGGTSYTAKIPTTSFNSASPAMLKYLPTGDSNGSYTYIKPSFTHYGGSCGS